MNKITIIGSGSVGSTIAYTLTVQGIASEIVMIDINEEKAKGEALDIRQGVPFCTPCSVYAGSYEDAKDSDIVIITSGIARKPGQTRLDLAQTNVNIIKSITPNITKYAPDAIYLFVSNPVDILTYVALKLSGLPANRVIGSGTVLDTARFKYVLGEHLGVDPRNVHARIVGEHGDSEIAIWSLANVSGIPIDVFSRLRGREHSAETMAKIENDVKNSAYEIIEKKHATYYGIAMSVKRICEAIVRDEKPILPVSNLMEGEYGISDIALSMPAVVGAEGIEYKVPAPFSDDEQARLRASADMLKGVIEKLDL